MPRHKEEPSVTMRFVSFGMGPTSIPNALRGGHKSPRKANAELQAMQPPISPFDLSAFPPLAPPSKVGAGAVLPNGQPAPRISAPGGMLQPVSQERTSAPVHKTGKATGQAAANLQAPSTQALQAQLQQAEARLVHAKQAAQQLLAMFQQAGYEVASGLDNLADDLDELEQVQERAAAVKADDGNDSDYMCTPKSKPIQFTDAAIISPQLVVSPGTEKMVMLRARREHVETAFIEMVRHMATGLETIAETCSMPPMANGLGDAKISTGSVI